MPIPNSSGATWPSQAEPDSIDFEIISAATNAYGIVSGCACTPASSGSTLGVAVASGSVHVGSSTPVAVTGATVTPGAAHSTLPRYDLVTANTSGTLAVVAGTAAAAPEFPAIPASRTVLCTVYIPAAATSITASNIVDKRQLVNRTPEFGTGATTTAAGNHNHAGQYASTLHADTHLDTGSDPITQLGRVEMYRDDGYGVIDLQAQFSQPADFGADDHISLYARWMGYRPVLTIQSLDREMFFGSAVTGPENLFLATPNTGTTLATSMLFTWAPGTISGTSTPTVSHPTPTDVLGFRTKLATAATAGSDFSVFATDLRWIRGNSTLPWCGYYYHARVAFEDASYNAAGATTGSRIFLGMTDQTGTTSVGADDPAGHRHGFQRVNVNGGKTQTNFFMTVKNGTTEAILDSGVALTQNHVYDFYIFVRPGGGYPFGQIFDLTAATTSGPMIDVSGAGSIPGTTTFMRPTASLRTINATARTMSLHRVGVEIPA